MMTTRPSAAAGTQLLPYTHEGSAHDDENDDANAEGAWPHDLRLPDVLMLQHWRESPVTSVPSYPIHD